MTGESVGDDDPSIQHRVDATDLGWVQMPGGSRDPAMFILASGYLALTSIDADREPDWFPLGSVTGLDALDAPVDGIQTIELVMRDGRRIVAGWHDAFCEQVVDALVSTLAVSPAAPEPIEPVASPVVPESPAAPLPPPADAAAMSASNAPAAPAGLATAAAPFAPGTLPEVPRSPGPPPAAPVAPVGPSPTAPPAAAPPPVVAPLPPADMPSVPDATADDARLRVPASAEVLREATESGPASEEGRPLDLTAAALVLEDVTYLGGYPGEDKKRKGCTATLTREDIEVSGPKGIRFRIAWDVVRSLEAQNADEARFRMNTKIHRDATALVLECDQGVTLLLEARDCPTIPLRGAIAQLIDGLPVVVV